MSTVGSSSEPLQCWTHTTTTIPSTTNSHHSHRPLTTPPSRKHAPTPPALALSASGTAVNRCESPSAARRCGCEGQPTHIVGVGYEMYTHNLPGIPPRSRQPAMLQPHPYIFVLFRAFQKISHARRHQRLGCSHGQSPRVPIQCAMVSGPDCAANHPPRKRKPGGP